MDPIGRLFLIDDDEIFVYLTRKTIESTGLVTQIRVFGDGEEGIEHMKNIAGDLDQLPDMIFLDLNMPVMDGWEFLTEYSTLEPQLGKKIPLYLVSSSISPHDIERAKNFEAVTDFIIKPLDKDKIAECVKKFHENNMA